ncbi:MAG: hypothetical protein QOJ97_335 [Solirubrobacteraceae bacterium]|jgi:hypothetical protein|nr:hypothetical protein [Solirubrobacteraceae bacterium]
MRFRGIGTVAVALALAAPASASATTWSVDPAGGACTTASPTCGSIAAAAGSAGNSDEVVILPKAGGWAESVTFAQAGIVVRAQIPLVSVISTAATTLSFTGAGARLEGLRVENSAAAGTAVRFSGAGDNRLTRAYVLAHGNTGTAVEIVSGSAASSASRDLTIDSAVVSGGDQGVGISARTVPDGGPASASQAGPILVMARHLTSAGQGKSIVLHADADGPCGTPGMGTGTATVSASIANSIVHPAPNPGDFTHYTKPTVDAVHCDAPAPAAPSTSGSDTATPDTDLFRSPAANDWLLRADAAAAIDKGADTPAAGETDVEGEGRRSGGATDLGADEFVNRAPAFNLVTAPAAARTGEAVAASVENVSDPEAAYGGGIAEYSFDWGDGSPVERGGQSAHAHAYPTPGQWTVTVTVTDLQGGSTAKQGSFQITSPPNDGNTPVGAGGAGLPGIPTDPGARPKALDTSPPLLAITTPRTGQRVRLGRATPTLRGRTADESGVRRVELALLRLEGRRCLWYDGRASFRAGPCTTARWFRAVLDDFDWRYGFPRTVRPRTGSYVLAARAVDYRGHMTTAPTAVAFRYVR